MTRPALLTATLLLVSPLSAQIPGPVCRDGDLYRWSPVPSEPVIQLAFRGGYGRARTDYVLFGDGRLQHLVRADWSAEPTEVTVQLTDEEVGRLVETAIRHGLVTTPSSELQEAIRRSGQEQIDQEMARTGSRLRRPPPLAPDDSLDYDLEIRLEQCAGLEPIHNRLHLQGLDSFADWYPEITELQGWLQIGGAMGRFLQERRP
jgi:hypothetical protein